MKRLVETTDGGFEECIGENVCLFCGIYIYAGTLVGVNNDHVELSPAKIVYDTGSLTEGDWETAQSLKTPWRVMIASIESWGPAKCE